MSTLLNVGVFLGGYCAISATAAASIWAIRREVGLPKERSIALPSKPNARVSVRKISLTGFGSKRCSTS